MRKLCKCLFVLLLLQGCVEPSRTIEVYKLEKYNGSEVPVCISYQQKAKLVSEDWYDVDTCGNEIHVPAQYEPIASSCDTRQVKIVPYDYCLATLPKPVHLVEKKEKDMTICYDRNNKVELPISYCQKDSVQITNVY